MTATIQVRRDTAANWTSVDPTLNAGEIGLETDTGSFKIGSGSTWNLTPYSSPTIPIRASVSLDLDAALYLTTGRYHFASGSGLTNGPSSPADIVAADGGAALLVVQYPSSIVVQTLTTEGNGTTQPTKSWYRVYDAAWRAWQPIGNWALSATEGVDMRARDLAVTRDLDVTNDFDVAGIPTNSVAPTWAQFAANLLLRGDAFGNQTVFAIQHWTANNATAPDLSNQTASITWNVAGIGTGTATVTPSAGTWWGMAVAFGTNGGGSRELRVIDTRDFTSASNSPFTLASGAVNIQNVFLFAIRAT
jgi:hypothetical protein